MALAIQNKPLYDLVPTGEPIMFTVFHQNILAYYKVKYTAKIYVAKEVSELPNNLIATLKATPNDQGRGMFDLSPILDNYVSPDYQGGVAAAFSGTSLYSTYKSQDFNVVNHSMHVIDEYGTNQNALKFFRVVFDYEFSTDPLESPVPANINLQSIDYTMWNGVLNDDDILKESGGDYGYHLNWNNLILNDTDGKFLTNAPLKQYIREDDYMTVAFFNNMESGSTPGSFTVGGAGTAMPGIYKTEVQFYYNGISTGSLITTNLNGNGAAYILAGESHSKLTYFGCGTANLDNAGVTIPANWDYYTLIAKDDQSTVISDTYYFYKRDNDCKGYETIRLTWLNKFGVWDYYNFNKKSIRTFSKTAIKFQQHSGTWNEDVFRFSGHKGGNRVFKSKAEEKITINTGFIINDEAVWLEELFISNDVFMINQNSTDYSNQGIVRKYVEPVTIESSEHIRKTKSNDGLIQYTFEILKSKNRKTHRR